MPDTQTLELVPANTGEPLKRADLPAIWEDFRMRAEKLKATAESLTVTDISQVAEMKLAKETRIALRDIRIAATKKHAELKADALATGQKLDKGKRELLALIEPLELRLEDQEKFGEREAVRLQQLKRDARTAEISPFLSGPLAVDVGVMLDAGYASLLADTKAAHAARIERERKAAEEAAAKVKAEAEERERIRLEIERLKQEALANAVALKVERERVAQEQAEAARKAEAEHKAHEEAVRNAREAAAAALAKVREDAARLAREAQVQADAEAARVRTEAEKQRKAAEDAARIAAQEREARETIEAEIAAKKAAEEKATAKAAAAPDKEKLLVLAKTVRNLHVPLLTTDRGIEVAAEVWTKVESFAEWITKKANDL